MSAQSPDPGESAQAKTKTILNRLKYPEKIKEKQSTEGSLAIL